MEVKYVKNGRTLPDNQPCIDCIDFSIRLKYLIIRGFSLCKTHYV